MVHKCLHHRVPIYLKDKFVYMLQVRNRCVDNNDLNLQHCRLSTGQMSFAFRGKKSLEHAPLGSEVNPITEDF